MKILIFSDVHGNLAALEAVLASEPARDLTVCLGDIVDYGPQPVECVELVRECAQVVVMGNHDYAVGNHADPRCSPAYRHLAQVTRDYSIQALDLASIQFLAMLPPREWFEWAGAQFDAVHAAPSDSLFRYLPPDSPDREWEAEVEVAHRPDMLLLGHTHLPMVKKVGSTTILNPGSAGQPKDGDPRAAYAIWEDGQIFLKRAEYDVSRTADAYNGAGLEHEDVARLIAALKSGGASAP